MELSAQIHAAAGGGALLLGAGVLAREPGRARNRLFSILCLALAVWNLGVAARLAGIAPEFPWHLLYLAGSCAAAPSALHFTLALARVPRRARQWMLVPAWIAAGALWLAVLPRGPRSHPVWNVVAIAVLGATLALALGVLGWRIRTLPRGPERSAFRLLLIAGAVTVVAGLTDLVPRHGAPILHAGPLATLFLLTIVCALVARHRFLDIDRFLVRALALLIGSAATTVLFVFIADPPAERILPLFAATFVVLALAGPVGRGFVSGVRGWFGAEETVLAALSRVSSALPAVTRRQEVWEAIGREVGSLPGGLAVSVHLAAGPGEPFRVVYRAGPGAPPPPDVPASSPLARFLEMQRGVVTRRILDDEAQDGPPERAPVAAAALGAFDALRAGVLTPLLRDGRLVGWVGLGGSAWESYLTARVATLLLAVANQAVASLERAEAVEVANRREALAAVGEMAAGLAHEVRNPLSAIHGAAQVVSAGADGARAREMLEVIQDESARLGRVVGEFLDYARPSSPRRESVDLADLARRALRTAEAAGATPVAEIREEAGTPRALGDPDQILRVLENLLRNAREAAGPAGRVRIEIAREEDGRARLRIEDDGPGVPPDQVPDLFKPFHTTKPGGTGLGLALVHRIVETHGGEIRYAGRPGAGAVFTILLPATECGDSGGTIA